MVALPDWARAHDAPLFNAVLRRSAADFVVHERLEIEFSGDGEHDYLHIRKTSANTHWVAEQLAAFAGARLRDIGYAGLKDRHAITEQWFSVPRQVGRQTDWMQFDAPDIVIIGCQRHRRKLRRGAHRGNAFRIALGGENLDRHAGDVAARIETIAGQGVPNYFGEQRFGRAAGNLELAKRLFGGARLSRAKRSIALSAARSLLFNEILHERVASDSWATLLPGECANLDGSGSIFRVAELTAELERRCEAQDLHPSGTLWGDGAPLGGDAVAAIEERVAGRHAEICDGLIAMQVKAMARPLRLCPRKLKFELTNETLLLEFELPRGAFATAVIREIASV